jgi:hypothetical protein
LKNIDGKAASQVRRTPFIAADPSLLAPTTAGATRLLARAGAYPTGATRDPAERS